jgi:putative SOS response-associated peptidase YedK
MQMPSWSKSALGGGPREPINARSETISEKPTFKKLVTGKRCIVPADGYFEWQKLNAKQRQPFFFRFPATIKADPNETQVDEKKDFIKDEHVKEEEIKYEFDPEERHPLTMAGLYDVWQNRETGEKIYTYCIITVPSAKKTQFVHERMPAIIRSFAAWSFPVEILSQKLMNWFS